MEETKPVFHIFFFKIETEEYLLTLYEASITLTLKPDKDITRKENYRLIFFMNVDAKILNEAL